MSKTSVDVNPGGAADALPVLGHMVDGVFVPIYSTAFGSENSATLVDADNPMPTTSGADDVLRDDILLDTMQKILKELQIMNLYNTLAHNQELQHEDTEHDDT